MTDCLSLRIKAKHLPVSSVSPKKHPAVKQMTWSHQSNSSLNKDSSVSTFVTPVSVAQDVLTLHTLHRWLTHFVAFTDSAIRCTANLSTPPRSTVTPLQYTCEGYAHVQIKPLICYNDRSHTFHFSTCVPYIWERNWRMTCTASEFKAKTTHTQWPFIYNKMCYINKNAITNVKVSESVYKWCSWAEYLKCKIKFIVWFKSLHWKRTVTETTELSVLLVIILLLLHHQFLQLSGKKLFIDTSLECWFLEDVHFVANHRYDAKLFYFIAEDSGFVKQNKCNLLKFL